MAGSVVLYARLWSFRSTLAISVSGGDRRLRKLRLPASGFEYRSFKLEHRNKIIHWLASKIVCFLFYYIFPVSLQSSLLVPEAKSHWTKRFVISRKSVHSKLNIFCLLGLRGFTQQGKYSWKLMHSRVSRTKHHFFVFVSCLTSQMCPNSVPLHFQCSGRTLFRTHQAELWVTTRVSCDVEIGNSNKSG